MPIRFLQGLGIVACLLLVPLHLVWLCEARGALAWGAAATGLALGALAADLVTGAVHWACDSWGSERTPWLGDGLIRSFREHHRDPRAMLDHDWMERNGQAAIPAAVCLFGMTLPASRELLEESPGLHGFLTSFFLLGAFANQAHSWAHAPAPPAWVRALQRSGLVLSPSRHTLHHAGRHRLGYCIATGWANPLLDRIGFWRAAERLISALTGAQPVHAAWRSSEPRQELR